MLIGIVWYRNRSRHWFGRISFVSIRRHFHHCTTRCCTTNDRIGCYERIRTVVVTASSGFQSYRQFVSMSIQSREKRSTNLWLFHSFTILWSNRIPQSHSFVAFLSSDRHAFSLWFSGGNLARLFVQNRCTGQFLSNSRLQRPSMLTPSMPCFVCCQWYATITRWIPWMTCWKTLHCWKDRRQRGHCLLNEANRVVLFTIYQWTQVKIITFL